MEDDAQAARRVAARLSIVALLWTYASVKLAWQGWPWALSAHDALSALAVSLGLLLGLGQGWLIGRRTGSRLVRWCREGRDLLLLARGFLVIAFFATFGITLKHLYLEKHPVAVGGVFVLASTSLGVMAAGLARLAWLEGSAQT